MTEDRRTEDGFFGGGARPGPEGAPPPRHRESALLARSPVFAVVTLGIAGWLLATLWPDLAYFASSRSPIDLGGPGAYRLAEARENRLVQVRGELAGVVQVSEGRSGAPRTVGRLAGTNLLVDRPGRGGPPVYEGRLLPQAARDPYGEVARLLREQGQPLPDGWMVLRDGERPRRQWWTVLGAALLVALMTLNLRALLRPLFRRTGATG
jgi:hypothetical protein